MDWEVIPDRQAIDHWRVEAINYAGDGEVYVAVFSGPDAQERAQEYADWKDTAVTGRGLGLRDFEVDAVDVNAGLGV